MDQLRDLPRGTAEALAPTLAIYGPLIGAAGSATQKPVEYSYGLHARHTVDLYLPLDATPTSKYPVLVFCHPGGFFTGSKSDMGFVGQFFAKQGYAVLIPNYRRTGEEEGAHPSGGLDIATLLQWVSSASLPNLSLDRVFLMGNSAGGCHVMTYAHDPSIPRVEGVTVAGVLLICSDTWMNSGANPHVLAYYGAEGLKTSTPHELLKKSDAKYPTFIAVAELDPDQVIEAAGKLLEIYGQPGNPDYPTYLVVDGHNHISLPAGLGLGGKEEAWGHVVTKWMSEQ